MRLAQLALLVSDKREQAQRIKLTRITCQDGTIDPFGLAQPSLAVQHHAVLDGLHLAV